VAPLERTVFAHGAVSNQIALVFATEPFLLPFHSFLIMNTQHSGDLVIW